MTCARCNEVTHLDVWGVLSLPKSAFLSDIIADLKTKNAIIRTKKSTSDFDQSHSAFCVIEDTHPQIESHRDVPTQNVQEMGYDPLLSGQYSEVTELDEDLSDWSFVEGDEEEERGRERGREKERERGK